MIVRNTALSTLKVAKLLQISQMSHNSLATSQPITNNTCYFYYTVFAKQLNSRNVKVFIALAFDPVFFVFADRINNL